MVLWAFFEFACKYNIQHRTTAVFVIRSTVSFNFIVSK